MDTERNTASNGTISLKELVAGNVELGVTHSGVVRMQIIPDKPDGVIRVAEARKNIPFNIERVYDIDELTRPEALRGKHAHRQLKQVIRALRGSFTLLLDDGKNKQVVKVDSPDFGVILDGLIWHDMTDFSADCLILVYADAYYNEADYIRTYDEFLELTK
ncbi:MAG: WxcM domain-containing protein [Microgenomates group bacterium Gr01-1014_5]|nr:MAG: WxcM domain-containing protein [Microgenomates group bacterium Gr01-1014_5]